MPLAQGTVGPAVLQDGTITAGGLRQGRLGDVIVSELHGRFFEQCFRGNLFSGGMNSTSINAATFTTGTLGNTATPIAGVWNPANSTVNLFVEQAVMGIILTTVSATGCGPFLWCASAGNTANAANISTGLTPFSRKNLQQTGSQAKNMAGVALTGLTNNLLVMGASSLYGGGVFNSALNYTVSLSQFSAAENFDGSIMVPPGGVLALLAATTPIAHSAASNLIWEEVPL